MAFDLRGQGRSEKPTNGYHATCLARISYRFREYLARRPVGTGSASQSLHPDCNRLGNWAKSQLYGLEQVGTQ